MRGFDRVQVLALDVFDEREFEHLRIGDILDDHGDLRNPGKFCGAPAAFSGDDLVAIRRVRRTISGWMMPLARMEAASSSSRSGWKIVVAAWD